jgi:Icc-related predicted phosphoesterase
LVTSNQEIIRVAAVGDLHCTKTSQGALQALFGQIPANADILLLCGDLTDAGLPEEGRILAKELTASVKIPIVGVLGNHDFHSEKQEEIHSILSEAGISVLNGDACEVKGIGFAGVKGFLGGFGRGTLTPWGGSSETGIRPRQASDRPEDCLTPLLADSSNGRGRTRGNLPLLGNQPA